MKTKKNILIAFILNFFFAIFEFVGGIFTNSVAIISDAVHDMGDALSIGISYFLEKKSGTGPDEEYTYGYARYSILGALITTTILTIGSVTVIYGAIGRIFNPQEINYSGMIVFAVFGVIINFLAAYMTRDGDSINQKAVNLHMLEDVLGWIVVLIGAVLMRFTDISMIDSIMSIGVAIFILVNALKNFKEILDLFLVRIPKDITVAEVKSSLESIKEIKDIHHIHIWSMDGNTNYATMHIKTDSKNIRKLKNKIKDNLGEHGIRHVTIEIEENDEECGDENCDTKVVNQPCHHH